MQFFSNRLGNVSNPHQSYEYEDAYQDEARYANHHSHYSHDYNASYDNGYNNRPDEHYMGGSSYSNRPHYQSGDANTYARGDYPPRSPYPNSTTPTPGNRSSGAASKFTHIAEAGHRITEVLVIEPTSFEEIPSVVQALRDYKSVVLNLAAMSPDYTQRAIDFITGGTHAMDGNYERIGEGIFLFTPSCVQVSTQAHST
ncbi:MAG: cell division protein SepF [Oculatellaceae cyanobacterium bins.114]|nr:cell division protein SepF [Oculatellaceae cyanobacterium bins.114]